MSATEHGQAGPRGPGDGHCDQRTSFSAQLLREVLPINVRTVPDPTPADGPDPYGRGAGHSEWLEIDWRQHLGQTTVSLPGPGEGSHGAPAGETRINYVEVGDGPETILFVHGLSGCWQNWLENIPHFARTHRVVALDLPGFGNSPMPDWDELAIPAYGELLSQFCDQLGIRSATVVGNSMGGFIAVESVLREPDLFGKLVLVSAAGISSTRAAAQPLETVVRMLQAMTPLVLEVQKRTMRRPRIRTIGWGGVFHRPRRLRYELLLEQLRGGTGRPGFVPAMRGLLRYDFTDRLDEIGLPTLIIWGRNDRIVPASDALAYERRIAGSRLEIFDDCGHVAMLERPVRFNRLLDDFIDSSAWSTGSGALPVEQPTTA